MTTKSTKLKTLGIISLSFALLACNGPEERKAKYAAEGQKYLEAGDYEKAALAYKNIQQIDPKDWENHFHIAELLSKQGKVEPAFREYNLVVSQDEKHVMARVRVGQILLLNNNIADSEKLADEALALEPENIEALVLKAGILNAKKEDDAAITTVEKALKISPDNTWATMMLASINVRINKTDEAINILKAAIEKKPDEISLLNMLGGIYASRKQMNDAENILRRIIEIEPKQFDHYKNLATFQIKTNQKDQAEATLRDAVEKLPENDYVKANLVDFLIDNRSPDVAIAELLPMIEKQPELYSLKFMLVKLQLLKKDKENAELTLNEIIEQDKLGPNGIRARNKLANIYITEGKEDQAKSLIKEVLEANPRDSESLAMRGEFELSENKISEAIADFRSVLVDLPNNTGVLKLLAAAHIRNKEDSLARENLEKVITIAPTDEQARLDLSNLLIKAGQKDQAKQQIDNYLQKNPNSLRSLEAMFKIYIMDKLWDKAQDITKRIQQINPKEPLGFYMSGLGYQAANRLDLAIDAFQQALNKKPDAVEPLNELVKTYMALKEPDKAMAKLQQTIKQIPDHMHAYYAIGEILRSEQKFNDAKIAYNKVIDLKPNWFAPYRSIAIIENAQNNKNDAINILLKGLEKTNGALELTIDLARIYHKNGEHAKVIELYENSYKAHPDVLIVANNLASYLSNYSQSATDLDKALKITEPFLKTNNPALLDTVGWIYYKKGNLDQAKENLFKAAELEPRAVQIQFHLGMLYYKLNNIAKAKEHLQKVVDSKSVFDGMEEAKQTLNKVQGE